MRRTFAAGLPPGMLPRSLLLTLLAATAAAEPFSFVALGDTTYAIPADNPLYEKLIQAINDVRPAFSIHVGDTKGFGDCGRAFQESQRAFFDRFAAPLFYAPGNNEWADCWKENRGAADPTEILKLMREVFWSEPRSLGASRLALVREADALPEFSEFAENARWTFGGGTFKELRYEGGPFEAVVKAIAAEADAFEGQVLVVHGHYHEFTIDRPLSELDIDKPSVSHPNVTRLQVYGWPDMKAVRVSVDPSKPWVFGFEPVHASEGSVSPHKDN
jgi:hypothetical protein